MDRLDRPSMHKSGGLSTKKNAKLLEIITAHAHTFIQRTCRLHGMLKVNPKLMLQTLRISHLTCAYSNVSDLL